MKKALLILATLCAMLPAHVLAADPIKGLLERTLPSNGDAEKFVWTLDSTAAKDAFTVGSDGATVTVSGSNYVSIATGINWYLQHAAGIDIAWNNPTATLPASLPAMATETHTAAVDYRYYLNFCTFSYSMSFWGWDRWLQELDWMALHGINLPLMIVGMECVWKDLLQTGYGYEGLDGVNEFVTGAAYYGWFFMNNMTAWGGPQPESWFSQREALAKQIFARMNDYGMQPVIPGYVGMVPKNFLQYADASLVADWTESDIVNGGTWNRFERPYFVNNTTRLREFGRKYYEAIDRVFGDVLSTHFYAIDPFHEGGVPSGVTSANNSVVAMRQALQQHDAQYVWVAQHWQSNPTEIVTHNIPRGRLLILNLHGDSHGQTECSGYHTTSSGSNHDWVWGHTSNFGGNVGLFGRAQRMIDCYYTALSKQASSRLVGVGAIPEGIENNSMLYDLLYQLPWTSSELTMSAWLEQYVTMRYGVTKAENPAAFAVLKSVWQTIVDGPLNCQSDGQQGTTESVMMMRPWTSPGVVSTWAGSSWYWDIPALRNAVLKMRDIAPQFAGNNNFEYDLVDFTRQTLADHAKLMLDSISSASGTARKEIAERFLALILDQDALLGTRSEFRLGRWIEQARALGETADEKALYEKNARMLLTTWGDAAQCNSGGLHDYANREWNGLLASYYYPRWRSYVDNDFNYYSWFYTHEWPFVTADHSALGFSALPAGAAFDYGTFSAEPEGDAITVATEMLDKYFGEATEEEAWVQTMPDFSAYYCLVNDQKWRGDAGTEGLNLSAPNSDYSAGYRLQRSTLDASDEAFIWRFEQGSADGTVRVVNLKAEREARYGAYLSTTVSSSAYKALTLQTTGSDFELYTNGSAYYLKSAEGDVFMAPDVAWPTACVLAGTSLQSTSYLRLLDVTTTVGMTAIRLVELPDDAPAYSLSGKRLKSAEKGQIVLTKGGKRVVQ